MYLCGRSTYSAPLQLWGSAFRESRDVVFEDVGFERNSRLTLNNRRFGDFAPKADIGEGF